MTLQELTAELRDVCPELIFLPSRIVRRAILASSVGTYGVLVPHEHCLVLERSEFEAIVEPHERPQSSEANGVLRWAVLLPEISPATYDRLGAEWVANALWRTLLHALVDKHFLSERALEARELAARVQAIGHTEFDEIRAVLQAEGLVGPTQRSQDAVIYREFVALFVELTTCAQQALGDFFPTLQQDVVAELIRKDLDFEALAGLYHPPALPLKAKETDEEGATSVPINDAWLRREATSEESPHRTGSAKRAVRAMQQGEPEAAFDQLYALSKGLSELPSLSSDHPVEAKALFRVLWPVLARDSTAAQQLNQNHRFLIDLERAVRAHHDGALTMNLRRFVTTRGQEPLHQNSPELALLRIHRRLLKALARLPKMKLTAADETPLRSALEEVLAAVAAAARHSIGEAIEGALSDSGLLVEGVVDEVARQKLVGESLDSMMERSFSSLDLVRDSLSRNNLKMQDVRFEQFLRGDELLSMDRSLARRLPGVHRGGEVYRSVLQRGSALFFGTRVGRGVTRWGVLPFGGAYVALEGLQHIVSLFSRLFGGPKLHLLSLGSLLLVGVFFFALLHSRRFAHATLTGLRWFGAGLRHVFVGLPKWFFALPWVQRILSSAVITALRRWFLKPILIAALLWAWVPLFFVDPTVLIAVGCVAFVLTNLLINSRVGRVLEEVVWEAIMLTWGTIRHRVLPNLLRWLVFQFRRLTNEMERAIYAVEEALRAQRGQSRPLLVIKTIGASLWFLIAYILRIYITLLIEPQVNPIKHFPVVTVSHKMILPFSLTLTAWLSAPLEPVLGMVLSNGIVGTTVFLLPGVFGFLVWELKENWKLYEANRSQRLRPDVIGSHGETMLRLLRPGFHSGTVPKLFAKIRKAERNSRGERDARARRRHRAALDHVAHKVETFVERQFVAILQRQTDWRLTIKRVQLGSNRISIFVERTGQRPMALDFEEQSGWLVAGVVDPGWAAAEQGPHRLLLEWALAGLYAYAGVDFVRQHIRAALPADCRYDLSDHGLQVWPPGAVRPWTYQVTDSGTFPLLQRGDGASPAPLESDLVRFGTQGVEWRDWRAYWERTSSAREWGMLTPALTSRGEA